MQNPDDLREKLCRAMKAARQTSSDFDLNPDLALPDRPALKQAAVLVAVTEDAQLILTKRSTRLKHHPGQIAFPGGRRDDTDRDLVHTALREAEEEIGLNPQDVSVLGELPYHETVTNYVATPIVGIVPSDLQYKAEAGEVAEIFTVPLLHVMSVANFAIEGRHWQGARRHYYTVPYGPYYIWGATARMLRGLAEQWT
ncbi:CoA pyrophosphatase [Octadecabacter sp.]|nr:CoA pyrophosphatase [Octadecabacter sp.]